MRYEHETLFDYLLREFKIHHPKEFGIHKAIGIGLIIIAIIYGYVVLMFPETYKLSTLKSMLVMCAVIFLIFKNQYKSLRVYFLFLIGFMGLSLIADIVYNILTNYYLAQYQTIEHLLQAYIDTSSTIRLLIDTVLRLTIILLALSIIIREQAIVHPLLRALIVTYVLTLYGNILSFIATQMLDYHYLAYIIMPYVNYSTYAFIGLGMLLSGIGAIQRQKDSISAVLVERLSSFTIDDTAPMDQRQSPVVEETVGPQSPSASQ